MINTSWSAYKLRVCRRDSEPWCCLQLNAFRPICPAKTTLSARSYQVYASRSSILDFARFEFVSSSILSQVWGDPPPDLGHQFISRFASQQCPGRNWGRCATRHHGTSEPRTAPLAGRLCKARRSVATQPRSTALPVGSRSCAPRFRIVDGLAQVDSQFIRIGAFSSAEGVGCASSRSLQYWFPTRRQSNGL